MSQSQTPDDGQLAVRLEDVWASYNNSENIIKGVTMEVNEGSSYMIMGSSGAGKTTLLKILNGIIAPQRGSVKILGNDFDGIRSNRDFRSKIGYIPQNLGLVKNMNVLENVLMGALHHTGLIRSLTNFFRPEDVKSAEEIITHFLKNA